MLVRIEGVFRCEDFQCEPNRKTEEEAEMICQICDGKGFYPDHHGNCNGEDCLEYNCPVQVQCFACRGTGVVEESGDKEDDF